jgi:hypothetical protein
MHKYPQSARRRFALDELLEMNLIEPVERHYRPIEANWPPAQRLMAD